MTNLFWIIYSDLQCIAETLLIINCFSHLQTTKTFYWITLLWDHFFICYKTKKASEECRTFWTSSNQLLMSGRNIQHQKKSSSISVHSMGNLATLSKSRLVFLLTKVWQQNNPYILLWHTTYSTFSSPLRRGGTIIWFSPPYNVDHNKLGMYYAGCTEKTIGVLKGCNIIAMLL